MRGTRTYQALGIAFLMLLVLFLEKKDIGLKADDVSMALQKSIELLELFAQAYVAYLLAWKIKSPHPMKHEGKAIDDEKTNKPKRKLKSEVDKGSK